MVLAGMCAVAAGCRWDLDRDEPSVRNDAALRDVLDRALAASQGESSSRPAAETGRESPRISGTPRESVQVDETFHFKPRASDPSQRSLRFSIENRPGWARFDPTSGRLAGTPRPADIGTYDGIRISVSNGVSSASLDGFSVTVSDTQPGRATVYWEAPVDNVDGSVLTDLAGFYVYYGLAEDQLTHRIDVPNAGVSSLVVEGLSPATWYFAVAAYTEDKVHGDLSEILPYRVH